MRKKKKTRKTTKKSPRTKKTEELTPLFAVGHNPSATLSPRDEVLFKAFQSNLLSLISHELRTPLMGVLNALSMFEEAQATGTLTSTELVRMALSNAQRLNRTLSALLDLAEIESGNFHAQLREIALSRLIKGHIDIAESLFKEKGIRIVVDSGNVEEGLVTPVLADAKKFGRAIDLCFQSVARRAEKNSIIKIRVSADNVVIVFVLSAGSESLWETAWTEALTGAEGGVLSPGSAFAGTLQSEQAFLTRMEEGLGSELLLVHEIMRIHRGKFFAEVKKEHPSSVVTLTLKLPQISPEEGLRRVIASRAVRVAPEHGSLGSVALGLLTVPSDTDMKGFSDEIRKSLFRASDAVYALPQRRMLALILEDCKPEDAPLLLKRISEKVGRGIKFGVSVSPEDGSDADQLIQLAELRLAQS